MKPIDTLREKVPWEEFDYQILMNSMLGFSSPRDGVTRLLRNKDIVRVKKGIYIFGRTRAKKPYSRELLANLIYGPSAVSLEYAMHYYGLIPEHVESVTSVTLGKTKKFDTPVGIFSYFNIPVRVFSEGLDLLPADDQRSFYIVCPERALVDRIVRERLLKEVSEKEFEEFLFDYLRIDEERFSGLSCTILKGIERVYEDTRIPVLSDILKRRGGKR